MKPFTNEPPNDQGVVYRKISTNYDVRTNGRTISCRLSPQLYRPATSSPATHQKRRKRDKRQRGDPVAVGDEVRFIDGQDGTGLIVEVLPRENQIARGSAVPMPSARPFEQVIAANLNQVVIVFAAANPEPKWRMLDRYLVAAEANDLQALVCITKLDLAPPKDKRSTNPFWEMVEVYRRIGYPIVLTSAVTYTGIETLRGALQGHRSVLVGKSGVGKTSLLNALEPDLGLHVRAVSQATGKGRHTTSHLEMFSLASGGEIVDTPGVREFGLWLDDLEDLAWYFPEMRPYLGTCRFRLDCQHESEPGCAIREAIMAGVISPHRWQSYLQLRADP